MLGQAWHALVALASLGALTHAGQAWHALSALASLGALAHAATLSAGGRHGAREVSDACCRRSVDCRRAPPRLLLRLPAGREPGAAPNPVDDEPQRGHLVVGHQAAAAVRPRRACARRAAPPSRIGSGPAGEHLAVCDLIRGPDP